MSITSLLRDEGQTLLLKVEGRFDFKTQKDLRASYEIEDIAKIKKCIIDLRETTYMDSSALGMLLVLNDFFKNKGINEKVEIKNANAEVKDILELACMDKFFSLT